MISKKLPAIMIILSLIFLADACSKPYEGPPADFVIKNAKIVTIDKEKPRAQAVAVRGEFIIAVTSNKKIEQYIDKATTKVIDAKGRLVVPGFNDAHIHFLSGGSSMMNLDFRYVHDVQAGFPVCPRRSGYPEDGRRKSEGIQARRIDKRRRLGTRNISG